MCVAFLPSPTSLLGEYGNHQLAVVIYAASLAVARLMLTAVWWYASSGRLMDDELDDGMIRTYRIPTESGGSPYRSFRDLGGRLHLQRESGRVALGTAARSRHRATPRAERIRLLMRTSVSHRVA